MKCQHCGDEIVQVVGFGKYPSWRHVVSGQEICRATTWATPEGTS